MNDTPQPHDSMNKLSVESLKLMITYFNNKSEEELLEFVEYVDDIGRTSVSEYFIYDVALRYMKYNTAKESGEFEKTKTEILRRYNIMINNINISVPEISYGRTASMIHFCSGLCILGVNFEKEQWMDSEYKKPCMSEEDYRAGIYDEILDELLSNVIKESSKKTLYKLDYIDWLKQTRIELLEQSDVNVLDDLINSVIDDELAEVSSNKHEDEKAYYSSKEFEKTFDVIMQSTMDSLQISVPLFEFNVFLRNQ